MPLDVIKIIEKLDLAGIALIMFLIADTRLHLAMLVGPSVGSSQCNPELKSVFASLPLLNHLRRSCRVSGLVNVHSALSVLVS